MERFEVIYKCLECGHKIVKSYCESSEYGEWRNSIDIQQSNTDSENLILKQLCPKCGKGKIRRDN